MGFVWRNLTGGSLETIGLKSGQALPGKRQLTSLPFVKTP